MQDQGPASWFLFVFFGLLLLVNAAYTTGFGAEFCGRVLGHAVTGGGMTLLFLDFAALAWFIARRYDAGNEKQLQIANVMAIATLAGSCILTLAQIGLNVGDGADDGVAWWVGLTGLIVIGAFAVANFVAAYAYQHFSPAELKKEKERLEAVKRHEEQVAEEAERAAEKKADADREKAVRQAAQEQRNKLVDEANDAAFKLAADAIHAAKPVIAARLAEEAKREYFRALGMDDMIDYGPPTPQRKALTDDDLRAIIATELAAQDLRYREAEKERIKEEQRKAKQKRKQKRKRKQTKKNLPAPITEPIDLSKLVGNGASPDPALLNGSGTTI